MVGGVLRALRGWVQLLQIIRQYLQRRDQRKAARLQAIDEESKLDDGKVTHVEISTID
jgi:hypothetical protein